MIFEHLELRRANVLAFFCLEILPMENTETIQRIYYSLCFLSDIQYHFYDKTTTLNKQFFTALEYVLAGKQVLAKNTLSQENKKALQKIFPYKNHWIHRMYRSGKDSDVMQNLPILNYSSPVHTCPICSSHLTLYKSSTACAAFSVYLNHKQIVLCFSCLHPTLVNPNDPKLKLIHNYNQNALNAISTCILRELDRPPK